jgi:hypothetical protein
MDSSEPGTLLTGKASDDSFEELMELINIPNAGQG